MNHPEAVPLPQTTDDSEQVLDQLCINALRILAMDAVQQANSGHPGLPLGAAPMTYLLWTRYLRHNPANPSWPDRDRFVLSAGHGSMLLYGLLYLTGYRQEWRRPPGRSGSALPTAWAWRLLSASWPRTLIGPVTRSLTTTPTGWSAMAT